MDESSGSMTLLQYRNKAADAGVMLEEARGLRRDGFGEARGCAAPRNRSN